jgi:hypothetical protein
MPRQRTELHGSIFTLERPVSPRCDRACHVHPPSHHQTRLFCRAVQQVIRTNSITRCSMGAIQTTGISRTPKAIVAWADKDFVHGVCSGYLMYFHEYQKILFLTETCTPSLSTRFSMCKVPTCSMSATSLVGLRRC